MIDLTLVTANENKLTGLARCEQILCSLISKKIQAKICSLKELNKPSRFERYLYFILDYPGLMLRPERDSKSLLHFMDQNLAMFLNFIPITKKIAVNVYDIFPVLPKYWRELNLMDKLRYWIVFRGVKKADVIFTISEFTKQQIHEYLNFPLGKIHVFYEGISSNYKPMKKDQDLMQKYNIFQNTKVLLYVGSEQTRKNFGAIIKMFKIVNEKLPNTILVKVGEALWQREREKNLSLIKKLNLEKKIIFTGYVPESELPKFYNLADLFVCLTLDEGGTALPIVEAMACGKPVLISDIPVLRETIKEGIFVPPEDHTIAAREAVKILSKPRLAYRLGQISLKRAKFFRWGKAASKIMQVYTS